jgi:hypothetical protein
MATTNGANGAIDSRPIFFFDIDNCVCDMLSTGYVLLSVSLANNDCNRSFTRKVRRHRPSRRSTEAILTGGRRM